MHTTGWKKSNSKGGMILTWGKPKNFDRKSSQCHFARHKCPMECCGTKAVPPVQVDCTRQTFYYLVQTDATRTCYVRKNMSHKIWRLQICNNTAVAAECYDTRIAHTVHYVILIRNPSTPPPSKRLKPLSLEHIFIHKESDLTFFLKYSTDLWDFSLSLFPSCSRSFLHFPRKSGRKKVYIYSWRLSFFHQRSLPFS